jgi:protoheme IX farnesyltransferase
MTPIAEGRLPTTDRPLLALRAAVRCGDFALLTKPRIAVLVLFTVAVGSMLAARGIPDFLLLANTLLGAGLVAAGASALNQLLERHTDGLMRRTENRPLPSGRLQPWEVLVFGLMLSVGGLLYLALTVRGLAVVVAGVTLLSYVFLYTPLKTKTTLNTLVGAVPGALPPVIGWTAVTGSLDAPVVVLFLIVFLWQVPHFLAIAWIYREDYGKAGLLMLPVVDPQGGITGRQMLVYCLALVPVSLSPVLWQQAGIFYAFGALVLGASFFWAALGFVRDKSNSQARRVLKASLIYLPLLLALLLLENLVGAPVLAW